MTILNEFLRIAKAEIGVHETPGCSANSRIIEYDATTTLKAQSDEVPWCSAFVNWVCQQAGLKGTQSAAARSWLNWGDEARSIVPGCIAVLKRGDNSALGHVGFVSDKTSLSILLLGGNQDNSVCEKVFLKTHVISYRVPSGFYDSL